MSVKKVVSGIAALIVGLYVTSQMNIGAPVEVDQSATAAIANTASSGDTSGLAGLMTTAIVISAVGALVAKIKRLF